MVARPALTISEDDIHYQNYIQLWYSSSSKYCDRDNYDLPYIRIDTGAMNRTASAKYMDVLSMLPMLSMLSMLSMLTMGPIGTKLAIMVSKQFISRALKVTDKVVELEVLQNAVASGFSMFAINLINEWFKKKTRLITIRSKPDYGEAVLL